MLWCPFTFIVGSIAIALGLFGFFFSGFISGRNG
jgi:hypothetical protein